jgi:hypothetical protein
MKADFSRGFNPDQKRGKQYRRVLLQQGRVLLDSDAAALVDANDRLLRQETQDLGTDAGGRKDAFLVTDGHLYAIFDGSAAFRITAGGPNPPLNTPDVRVDYNARFRDRLPTLLIQAGTQSAVTVAIDLMRPHLTSGNLVIWAATSSTSATLQVSGAVGGTYTGAPPTVHFPPQFDRLVFHPTNTGGQEQTISITVAASQRVWIGLIESELTASTPRFWIQPGSYHLQGLTLNNPTEANYPDQGFPASVGFPPTGSDSQLLTISASQIGVAYLEGWERMITALQDPGIREQALSTSLDTTVRTAAVPQVKTLVFTSPNSPPGPFPTAAQIRTAFANHFVPTGTMSLTTGTASVVDNPCAITLDSGFTGRENHLYHFEVHSFDGTTVLIKWSREAGSELFGVATIDRANALVGVPNTSLLRNGDLVEVLTDVVELGDQAPGALTLGGGSNFEFLPSHRDVGVLATLSAQGSDAAGNNVFLLVQPNNPPNPVNLDARRYSAAAPGIRLRRWHGTASNGTTPIPPAGSVTPAQFNIESGLILNITGTFEVGDWWQFEARLQPNLNSTPILTRHGPERLFSPLALLGSATGNLPQVTAWLDQPFVPAAQLDADHVKFDPTVALLVSPPVTGTDPQLGPTSTMQGIIDDLLRFGPGQTIVKQITEIIDGQVTGNWQLSVGDGVNSFGDFNGPGAIHRAIDFIRAFTGVDSTTGLQRPWSMRLLCKRGNYILRAIPPVTPPHSTIFINDGETLILEGEGIVPPGEPFPTEGGYASGTNVSIELGPQFNLSGPGARLEMENLTFSANGNQTCMIRQGHAEFRSCLLNNPGFTIDSAPIPGGNAPEALVVKDCTFNCFSAAIKVFFGLQNGVGNVSETAARARVENCDVTMTGAFPFVEINGSPSQAGNFDSSVTVRWDGVVVKECTFQLAGGTDFNPFGSKPGLAGFTSVSNACTIGDLIFEDCRVDAGTSTDTGVFLHLPTGIANSGSDQATVERVILRRGRWSTLTDISVFAPFYVGGPTFLNFDQGGNLVTGVDQLIVEDMEFGWTSTSNNLSYGASPLNIGSAFSFSADDVQIRNLKFFGRVLNSGAAEAAFLASSQLRVEGLNMPDEVANTPTIVGIAHGAPDARVRINVNKHVNVSDSLVFSNGGPDISDSNAIVVVTPVQGASGPAILERVRVQGGSNAIGIFVPSLSGLAADMDFFDCEVFNCVRGIQMNAQNISSFRTSTMRVRGGRFNLNQNEAVLALVADQRVVVVVEGISALENGNGITILPTFSGNSWFGSGPVVLNNQLFNGENNAGASMQIGALDKDEIGGVCMGNIANEIRVDVLTTYNMRGLATEGIVPWGRKLRVETANPHNTSVNTTMTLNSARWNRNVDGSEDD